MTAARQTLPNRRPSQTSTIVWSQQTFEVTVGFGGGKPKEVFANSGKTPEAIHQIVSDACILVSIALQHGVPAEALAKSLARFDDGSPYTIVGLICDAIRPSRDEDDALAEDLKP